MNTLKNGMLSGVFELSERNKEMAVVVLEGFIQKKILVTSRLIFC